MGYSDRLVWTVVVHWIGLPQWEKQQSLGVGWESHQNSHSFLEVYEPTERITFCVKTY